MDGENHQNLVRQSVERGEQRLASALGNISGSGNALASQQGASLPVNARSDGQLVASSGGLNGSLLASDPSYDPILEALGNVYISFWKAGQTVGSAPVAPY